ncbi:MAG: chalcone isomerase family protein [Rhodocyclaceae bacterium]|nr:chalcone isomerase family protein [Rhodocyclaceae bacterium]
MKRWSRKLLIVLASALVLGSSAAALPEPITQQTPDWALQGKGEMRWFGFQLYEARLWVPSAASLGARPGPPDGHFALELQYARDITSQRLVDASIDQMKRFGAIDEQRLGKWKVALERVFPNVKTGDVIVGVLKPNQGAEFYHQSRLSGRIDDIDFARTFFAIWLDERTSEPELRKRLLGLPAK